MPTIKYRIPLEGKTITENPQYFWIQDKTEIAVWTRKEKLFISHSMCPHMGAQLQLDKSRNQLTCPWHGLSFDTDHFSSNHNKYKKLCSLQGEVKNNEILIYASEPL